MGASRLMPESPPEIDPDDIETLDEDSRKQLGRLEEHYVNLRRVALFMAAMVIIALAVLEFYILYEIVSYQDMGSSFVFLAISPIVSIIAILVFVLIGVFKNSQEVKLDTAKMLQLFKLSNGDTT